MGGINAHFPDGAEDTIDKGRRSFVIKRAKPDGKSYDRDIAEKYGLSFESIRKNGGALLTATAFIKRLSPAAVDPRPSL